MAGTNKYPHRSGDHWAYSNLGDNVCPPVRVTHQGVITYKYQSLLLLDLNCRKTNFTHFIRGRQCDKSAGLSRLIYGKKYTCESPQYLAVAPANTNEDC